MFHPVGSQPPSVYWRRRLLVVGSIALLLVLLVVTVKIAVSGGSDKPVGAGTTTAISTPVVPRSTTPHSSIQPRSTPRKSPSGKHGASVSSTPPAACVASQLSVQAVVGSPTYKVGDKPVLELQVTNTGGQPCVQDLADKQIEMRVYNGESRVWGSHDCQIQPGTDPKTLAANRPVRVAITWSGLTSQPKCAGTRQRVGAGTYTLYALLAGHTGHAVQFTIS